MDKSPFRLIQKLWKSAEVFLFLVKTIKKVHRINQNRKVSRFKKQTCFLEKTHTHDFPISRFSFFGLYLKLFTQIELSSSILFLALTEKLFLLIRYFSSLLTIIIHNIHEELLFLDQDLCVYKFLFQKEKISFFLYPFRKQQRNCIPQSLFYAITYNNLLLDVWIVETKREQSAMQSTED